MMSRSSSFQPCRPPARRRYDRTWEDTFHAHLLVALLLLAAPATVSAECAWVLWGRHVESTSTSGPRDSGPWEFIFYYETNDDCWARITKLTSVLKEGSLRDSLTWLLGTGVYRVGNKTTFRTDDGVTVYLGEKGSSSIDYRCLPETFGPRGAMR